MNPKSQHNCRWALVLKYSLVEVWSQKLRFLLLTVALAIGLGTYLAVTSSVGSVRESLDGKTKDFLGADIAISLQRSEKEEEYKPMQNHPAVEREAKILETTTVAHGLADDSHSRLVELKAVSKHYPLLDGYVVKGEEVFAGVQRGGLLVDESLMRAWGLNVAPGSGDANPTSSLRLGEAVFPIVGVLVEEPGRLQGAFSRGARVILSHASLEKTKLITPFSRFRRKLLLILKPQAEIDSVVADFKEVKQNIELRTHQESAQRSLRPLKNVLAWLRLVSFTVLVLTLFMMTNTLTSYFKTKWKTSGLYRALGLTPTESARFHYLVLLYIFVFSGIMGVLLGFWLNAYIPELLQPIFPKIGDLFGQYEVNLQGLLFIYLTCFFFVLPSLAVAHKEPILQLLKGVPQLSFSRGALSYTLGVMVFGLLGLTSFEGTQGILYSLALIGVVVLFTSLLYLIFWLLDRSEDYIPLPLRLSILQVRAQGLQGIFTLATISLSIFFSATCYFIANDLTAPLVSQEGQLPSSFLFSIAPDEKDALLGKVKELGDDSPFVAPMVFSRIVSINGKPTEKMLEEAGISEAKKRFLSRETNLSYKWELNETETLEEGTFWTQDSEDINQISLDENFANNLDLKMGDAMVFDIQGVEIEAKVTSIRSVKWQNMRPNFFVIVPPRLLEGAPLSYVMSASLRSAEAKQEFQEYIYANHPSVMNIDISEVAKRVQGVLKDIVQLTQFFLYFIVAIALFVILNACLETRKFRVKDIALLRTLGAGKGTLSSSWLGEFFLMGLSSSTLGVLVSIAVTSYVANVLLSLSVTPSLQVSGLLILLACTGLTVLGMASTVDLLFKKPFGVLKSAE